MAITFCSEWTNIFQEDQWIIDSEIILVSTSKRMNRGHLVRGAISELEDI